MEENKIIIYQTEDGKTQIDVHLKNETVWLSQTQMAELFQTDRTSIVRHINNIYKSNELDKESTCAKIAQVRTEEKDVMVKVVVNLINQRNEELEGRTIALPKSTTSDSDIDKY